MPKILFVDDSRTIVSIFKTLLEKSGYVVVTVMDGAKVLEAAQEHKPDLIILDGELPHLSGFDVCRQLRLDPGMKSTKIMMFTGGIETEERRRAQEAGADRFHSKNAEPHSLLGAAQDLLKK